MYREETEIIQVLENGRKILSEKSDLKLLSVKQLLDFLDDGTQEMLHNRWGAAACLCVDRIEDFSYKGLVGTLSAYENIGLLCSYTAFILQKEYGISVVSLLIEAEKQKVVHRIIPFVSDNIIFEEKIEEAEVVSFLEVICKLPNDQSGYLLETYADFVISKSLGDRVIQILFNCRKHFSAKFMSYLCQAIYKSDYNAGESLLGDLMVELDSDTSFINAVLDGLCLSTYRGVGFFEKHFQSIKKIKQDHVNWKRLIPVFANYIERQEQDSVIKKQVLVELEKIVEGTIEEKRIFLKHIVYCEKPADELVRIRDMILECSFEKDDEMLDILQTFFYVQKKRMGMENVLCLMHQIFILNKYDWSDYEKFFNAFSSCLNGEQDSQIAIWRAFLKAMFVEGEQEFLFALGLYEKGVTISSIAAIAKENKIAFPELILLVQLLTYYDTDAKRVCKFAFEIAQLVDKENREEYIQVYMDEVYLNYCQTSHEVANAYMTSTCDVQAKLAQNVITQYETEKTLQNAAWSVPDLRPSTERSRIYRKIMNEQNSKINKLANERSLFAQLFPRHVMRYGKRSAHVQNMRQGKKTYTVQPYTVFKHGFELPALYMQNPLEWENRRHILLQKRGEYIASNNQRLPFTSEGKG